MTNPAIHRILALSGTEPRDALCFLAGFNPYVLEQVLNEMDRQRQYGIDRAARFAAGWDHLQDDIDQTNPPTIGSDYTLTTEDLGDGQTRTLGTCLACGTETGWSHQDRLSPNLSKAERQIIEHVTAEWMSHS